MKSEFPRCSAKVEFEIPSPVHFGERKKISLEGTCKEVAQIISDNLQPATQAASVQGNASIQIKDKKVEHYTVKSKPEKFTVSEKISEIFASFDRYTRSRMPIRFCRGQWMKIVWNNFPVINREDDTVSK